MPDDQLTPAPAPRRLLLVDDHAFFRTALRRLLDLQADLQVCGEAPDLATAVAMRDKAMVARAPGVGPKVAERIVTELKDKAPAYAALDPAVVRLSGAVEEKRAPQPIADAVSALVNLGYGRPQAASAVAAAARSAGEGADAANLIRLGLRELAK